jgi:putative toxin-antitoxin system antitoxin component (TIGR02293 family)
METETTLLGLAPQPLPRLLESIREGLPFETWEEFLITTGLGRDEAAPLLQVSERTLSRRKKAGRLDAHESDRLVRAARVYAMALQLQGGDHESARRWLRSPQRGLGGASPLEYASTDVGVRQVEELIGRIEHGIPA